MNRDPHTHTHSRSRTPVSLGAHNESGSHRPFSAYGHTGSTASAAFPQACAGTGPGLRAGGVSWPSRERCGASAHRVGGERITTCPCSSTDTARGREGLPSRDRLRTEHGSAPCALSSQDLPQL